MIFIFLKTIHTMNNTTSLTIIDVVFPSWVDKAAIPFIIFILIIISFIITICCIICISKCYRIYKKHCYDNKIYVIELPKPDEAV